MTTSAFNPDLFMQTSIEGEMSTTLVPCPEGEYAAVIKDLKPRVLSNGSAVMDITWAIDDETVKKVTGMNEPTVRQSIWLDTTESGGLDMAQGRNVGLGRLREAVNQNVKGRPWVPTNLIGQVARVKVTHTADKNDSSVIYANITAVTKL